MANPFEINEKPSVQFGNFFLSFEQKQGANSSYYRFDVDVAPLGGGDLIQRKYFNFQQTPNDTKIFLAGLNEATNNKPMDLVNPDGSWVEYQWEPYRDYGKKTIQYYTNNNPKKLQTDEKGRGFVEKAAIKLIRVFSSEDDCILAHDKANNIQNNNDPFSSNGVVSKQSEPEQMPKETALAFIQAFVKQCTENGRVNRDKLAAQIAEYAPVAALFSVQSPEVEKLINEVELEPVF